MASHFYFIFNEGDLIRMTWPPQSPDLSPVEQWFHLIKSRLQKLERSSDAATWRSLQKVWGSITLKDLRKYIDTMPDRCRAVIAANGGHTRY